MSVLIKADKIHVGNAISFPKALEVIATGVNSQNVILWIKINEEKECRLEYPADSILEVHEPEGEAPEMPDEGEIWDRLLSLAVMPGPIDKNACDVLAYLAVNQVIDIPRLIELTNDLGPFEATPVRKCRVCGCTDDDCSQCIEASGGPCWWVEKNLCSRCKQEATDKAWQALWDGDANPSMILTPPSIAISGAAPPFNCDAPCPDYPHCTCVSDEDFIKMINDTE